MPAYAVTIARHPCQDCGAPASVDVFTTRNEPVGKFCTKHATALVNRLNTPTDTQPKVQ